MCFKAQSQGHNWFMAFSYSLPFFFYSSLLGLISTLFWFVVVFWSFRVRWSSHKNAAYSFANWISYIPFSTVYYGKCHNIDVWNQCLHIVHFSEISCICLLLTHFPLLRLLLLVIVYLRPILSLMPHSYDAFRFHKNYFRAELCLLCNCCNFTWFICVRINGFHWPEKDLKSQ